MSQHEIDLNDAREAYFAAGGFESDLGPRDNPTWYWRRAYKLVSAKLELGTSQRVTAENLCVLLAASLSRAIYEDTVLDENELTEGLPADWRAQVASMKRRTT